MVLKNNRLVIHSHSIFKLYLGRVFRLLNIFIIVQDLKSIKNTLFKTALKSFYVGTLSVNRAVMAEFVSELFSSLVIRIFYLGKCLNPAISISTFL